MSAKELSQFCQHDICEPVAAPCTQLDLHTEGSAVKFGALANMYSLACCLLTRLVAEVTSAALGAALLKHLKLVSAMLPSALCRGHVCKFCVIAVQPDFGFASVSFREHTSLFCVLHC